jgi:hypothetical protein
VSATEGSCGEDDCGRTAANHVVVTHEITLRVNDKQRGLPAGGLHHPSWEELRVSPEVGPTAIQLVPQNRIGPLVPEDKRR